MGSGRPHRVQLPKIQFCPPKDENSCRRDGIGPEDPAQGDHDRYKLTRRHLRKPGRRCASVHVLKRSHSFPQEE